MLERISEWCAVMFVMSALFILLGSLAADVAQHTADVYAINCLLLFVYSILTYCITKSIIHSYKLDKKMLELYRNYSK